MNTLLMCPSTLRWYDCATVVETGRRAQTHRQLLDLAPAAATASTAATRSRMANSLTAADLRIRKSRRPDSSCPAMDIDRLQRRCSVRSRRLQEHHLRWE